MIPLRDDPVQRRLWLADEPIALARLERFVRALGLRMAMELRRTLANVRAIALAFVVPLPAGHFPAGRIRIGRVGATHLRGGSGAEMARRGWKRERFVRVARWKRDRYGARRRGRQVCVKRALASQAGAGVENRRGTSS